MWLNEVSKWSPCGVFLEENWKYGLSENFCINGSVAVFFCNFISVINNIFPQCWTGVLQLQVMITEVYKLHSLKIILKAWNCDFWILDILKTNRNHKMKHYRGQCVPNELPNWCWIQFGLEVKVVTPLVVCISHLPLRLHQACFLLKYRQAELCRKTNTPS